MKLTAIALFAFLNIVVVTAYAQTACPQGVTPGSSQCLPTGSAATQAPSPPPPKWRTTWGAFASDAEVAVTGTSSDQPSRRAASNAAMAKCESMGGKQCRITLAYENQCAVIAEPVKDLASLRPMHSRGPTIVAASNSALRECALVNQGNACKIIYSNCTRPVLVN